MTINILMPALSPTMTEGTLATWHKKEGDKVKSGDVIAEIETDKATMEVEAVDEGVIGKIVVPEGTENVPVNEIIAILLEDGEDAGALKGGAAAPKAEAKTEAPAEPKAEAKAEAPAPATQPAAAGPVAKPAAANGHDDRVFASPLARRMAEQAGIDLAALKGTGPNGRVVKADIDAAVSGGSAPAAKPAAAAAPEAAKPAAAPAAAKPTAAGPNAKQLADAYGIPYSEQKHSNMRKVVARRLLESKLTVPHFYLTVDIQLDALLKLRKELNDRGDVKLSVNDLIIKAAALSLRKVPAANTSWTDDALIQYERVDISVAVATPGGLITPIIKDADRKGLSTISAEMKDLAARARDGKLKPEEYQGGTFSISNLGMFGIKDFAAIINPPQACILAVGAGAQQPVVKDGALAIATVMSCTLSVDHRVVDGAVGAEYLAAFKALVEAPLGMML
ncbi:MULTISPECIES: pyruvate dehydrogenase complex dihydrolipoamide acetyltransferase [unclassified Inquilinus]|uniref:pyruvate dehydrogenase complex dihydrolipoamide acetyltransferase n=1 Tax=unclassified Inquilinus TaxID=2645927 RepID=UPI003F92EC66